MKAKKGYVLVFSVIAMLLTCALILSTVTVVLYYGNNVNRTIGGSGALYVADSGIAAFEDYLNAYYIDKGNIKTNSGDLWITVYDIVEEIVPMVSADSDGKALLALQGYLNYNYVISAVSGQHSLSADEKLSGSYKIYIATQRKNEIRNNGKISLLSVGEYVYQNKSYYKFITVEAVIEPIYDEEMITGLRLKTVDYSESIKGGTTLWGNVSW